MNRTSIAVLVVVAAVSAVLSTGLPMPGNAAEQVQAGIAALPLFGKTAIR